MEPWRRLDLAPPAEARELLLRCCGSTRWVDRMLERRPFGSLPALLEAASSIWLSLTERDWREAFGHHPKIGDKNARGLAAREQSSIRTAPDDVVRELAEGNAVYESKFGFIFIVCATGLSADSMLAMLNQRLGNDPATEITIAAAEQAKITELRLRTL
jgi:2-oxo-4-hydroxy-4-carboxy-5-ureidoimidazoline decarboxylase